MAKKLMSKNKLPIASTAVDMPKPSKDSTERERRWRAEDALRVAQQHESNKKDSGLMRDMKSVAKEKMKELKSVCGGKDE